MYIDMFTDMRKCCRDAKVHWFKCGWLSVQYFHMPNYYSSGWPDIIIQVLLAEQCSCQTLYKRTNYQKSLWVYKFKYIMHIIYTKIFHILIIFFFNKKIPPLTIEIGLWISHFYGPYIILIVRLTITDFDT